MPIGNLKSRLAAIAIAGSVLTLAAACGNASSDGGTTSGKAVSIDVGLDKPIVVHTRKPRIAWFGSVANLYVQAQRDGMQAEAKKRGFEFTVVDSKFDPLVQRQQIENAIQSKKYDAFIVDPFDPNALCPILTKDAPAAGIVVVTAAVTMCDTTKANEGDDSWAPGSLAQIGNQGAPGAVRQFYREVNKRIVDGKKHVAMQILGPELNPATIGGLEGLRQSNEAGEIPNLDVKYIVYTDYSTAQGLSKTQTFLQAHPEVDIVMSNYSDITMGVLAAIKKAGLEGKVKVYDQGGSRQSVDAVKAGTLEFTTAFHPYNIGVESVAIIGDAFNGKQNLPRFSGGFPSGEGPGNHLIVDKSNVDTFKVEY